MAQAYKTPAIPPDALHLTLYPPPATAASHTATLALAAQLRSAIGALLPPGWVWHRDALELKVERWTSRPQGADQRAEQWVVRGGMRVGESIDDEWVGVWLVRELTRRFPDVVGSVYDVDGDFLLIEAAAVLPSWVSPQNSENRLLLAGGALHLLPLSLSSPPSSRPPKHERRLTLDDEDDDDEAGAGAADGWLEEWKAVDEVRHGAGKYRHEEIERAVWDRIACHPAELPDHQHKTTLYLPTPIALALARQPALVQKAVEAFYTRDPSQLRRVAKMTTFSPSAESTTRTQIATSRVAFAQLEGQNFHPSKAFGPEWTPAAGGDAREAAERARGVKVAVGFEILVSESKARPLEHPELDSSADSAAARLSLLRSDPEFATYLDTLTRAGWFGAGEIAGSQRWKEREEEAARAWVKLRVEDDSTQRPTFSTLFYAALALPGPTAFDLAPTEPDSDASWLQVDASELDALMAERSGTSAPSTSTAAQPDKAQGGSAMDIDLSLPADEMDDEDAPADADDGGLGKLAARVGKFVGAQGELDGAVFDDELMEDEPDSDDDADDDQLEADMLKEDTSSDDDEPLVLTNEQRTARMATLVKPLEPGQWGASTQLAPSSSSAATNGDASSAAPGPSAAASSFGVDDAQRRRDEVDRQAKLHALGELDAAHAQARPATKIRRPLLEKDSFDGVDSDDESDDGGAQEELGANGGMSGALKAAMARDGIEADDDEDEPMVVEDDDDDEANGAEVDMGEEEGEFIKFAREALGLDEQMWEKIVGERQQRGAFVPRPKAAQPKPADDPSSAGGLKSASLSTKPASTPVAPAASSKPKAKTAAAPAPAPSAKGKEKGVSFADLPPLSQTSTDAPDFSNAPMFMPGPEPDEPLPMRTRREKPREIPEGAVPDPSLNSFDAVMAAMDEHLARTKAAQAAAAPAATSSSAGKPKPKPKAPSAPAAKPSPSSSPAAPPPSSSKPRAAATPLASSRERDSIFGSTAKPPLSTPVYDPADDDDGDSSDGLGELDPDDPLLQMDAELRAALAAAGDLGSDDEDVDQMDEEDQVDYGLIKNFLESYKAQGGMAGPVGNLLGRLAEKKKAGK